MISSTQRCRYFLSPNTEITPRQCDLYEMELRICRDLKITDMHLVKQMSFHNRVLFFRKELAKCMMYQLL